MDRIRRLSRVLVHAVEISAGHIRPGVSEASVAGELSHRLIRRTVTPVRIQVCADGRNIRYRHWAYSEDPIESYATVSCVAKRWGLHVAVSRTVCLNQVPEELWSAHQKAVLIHATGMYFSRTGRKLKEIWPKVRRIYDKFGMPTEWQLADQAEVIGYRAMEHQLTPDSDYELQAPDRDVLASRRQCRAPGGYSFSDARRLRNRDSVCHVAATSRAGQRP